MKKTYVIIAFGVASVLLGSLFYSNVILAQSGGEYDPWIDHNEDGIVDVNDLQSLGQVYSASGDPTKSVNVENWPISRPVTLWYNEPLAYPGYLVSAAYNASGFGHLHMLIRASGLSLGEEVVVILYSWLWKPDRTGYTAFVGYSVTLSGSTAVDHIVTIPVPSEDFHFAAVPQAGTSCNFYMSIYMTWS